MWASCRKMFGIAPVSFIPTGVDVDYFTPPQSSPRDGLVFVGSMDWLPNIDGNALVLPGHPAAHPHPATRLPPLDRGAARRPAKFSGWPNATRSLKSPEPCPDVRPWLWNAAVSIVPLRIGGGTRMKIYEAMAARTPVVSTTIGAEGLDVNPSRDICIADDAPGFADRCLELPGR